jgi:hypothetical protein
MNGRDHSERWRIWSQTRRSVTQHADILVPLEQNGTEVAVVSALPNQFVCENWRIGQKVLHVVFHEASSITKAGRVAGSTASLVTTRWSVPEFASADHLAQHVVFSRPFLDP